MQRWLIVVAVSLVGFAVLFLGLAWVLQRHLIYAPSNELGAVPAGAEEITIATSDHLALGGWFFPAEDAGGRALVVFNGNGGNRNDRVPLAEALSERGWSVLLFDYRGYGDSPGSPSEEGLALDARAAADWLAGHDDVEHIAYLGESLGAAVAARLATERPPDALVLRSPFTSLVDVGKVHYPYLPVGLLLRDRFPVVEHVRGYDGPVLVITGSADSIVPTAQSRAVFEAARDARYVEIPGADHNDPSLLDGERLVDAIAGFLAGPA